MQKDKTIKYQKQSSFIKSSSDFHKKKKTDSSLFQKFSKSWKSTTTTKKWGVFSWGTALILTAFLIYGTFWTERDMGTFVIVVSCAWAEVAAYNAVYAWKAKCENRLKITYDFVDKMADKYGIDSITAILQNII